MVDTTVLTPRKKRFVEEYLVDANATRAAERAGYNRNYGRALVQDRAVAEALSEAMEERQERRRVLAERALAELERRAFLDPREVFTWGPDGAVRLKDISELSPEAAACVEISLTETARGNMLRVKLPDKTTALRELLKEALTCELPVSEDEEEEEVLTHEECIRQIRDLIPDAFSDAGRADHAR